MQSKHKNSKKIILLLAVLTMLFTLTSCKDEPKGICSLTIGIDKETRTIAPSTEKIKIASHKIYGSLDGKHSFTKDFVGNTCQIDNLIAGSYSIYVEGLNEEGLVIAVSETKTVTITQNQNASASFTLSYLQGRGTMDVSILIPESETTVKRVDGIITSSDDFSVVSSFTLLRNETTVENSFRIFRKIANLETGLYRICFTMYDSENNKVGFQLEEVLRVFKDQNSSMKWTWDKDYVPPVAEPTFDIASGKYFDGQELHLFTTEPDAKIYYTTDKSIPNSTSSLYEDKIVLDRSMTINAIAIKDGLRSSNVVTSEYQVQVKKPIISLKSNSFAVSQSVSLSSETEGSSIYYTLDGSIPSDESTPYTEAISIDKNCILTAIAIKDGLISSDKVSESYELLCLNPVFNIAEGTYSSSQNLRLSAQTEGAKVYYTLDGSEPSNTSLEYTSPISIDGNTVVKAITCKDGWTSSASLSKTYSFKCTTPTFSEVEGSYEDSKTIAIASQTPESTIYYTTDGSEPSTFSNVYSIPIIVDKDAIMKAIAVKSNYQNSDVANSSYFIAPQNTLITIKDPLDTAFRMGKPQGWFSGMNLMKTVSATLFIDTEMPIDSIKWFYDGYVFDTQKTSIKVGGNDADIPLDSGAHVIALRITSNGNTYGESLYYVISESFTDKTNLVSWGDITVGGIGPTGGIIVYDVDEDNAKGNSDGLDSRTNSWRYIEVASRDLRIIDSLPSVSSGLSSNTTFPFGYNRQTSNDTNLLANGTLKAFNTGKSNTEILYNVMGESTFLTANGTSSGSNYAAGLCTNLISYNADNVPDNDWFLPSVVEMQFIYDYLTSNNLSAFESENYWTSTEAEIGADYAYYFSTTTKTEAVGFRASKYGIRPIRTF